MVHHKLEELRSAADQLANLEEEIFRFRPGEVVGKIRRIDALIEARILSDAEDQGEIASFMAEKQRLRERLEERDSAQVELQALAQRAHEEVSALERITSEVLGQEELSTEDLAELHVVLSP